MEIFIQSRDGAETWSIEHCLGHTSTSYNHNDTYNFRCTNYLVNLILICISNEHHGQQGTGPRLHKVHEIIFTFTALYIRLAGEGR